jgi:iron complex transport system substrate-binding protein
MLVVGRSAGSLPGLYVSGGDSFLSELLEIAGGRNIFRNLSGYRQPSLEEIISLNPAIIIEIRNNEPLSEAKKTALKGDWHILHTVDAVINDRILIWTQPFLTIPGPRITAIYDKFKEVCHASAVP